MREADSDEITLLALANAVLRRRRRIARWGLALALIGAGSALIAKRQYDSTGSFLSQSQRPSGGLSGVASQLGISLPGSSEGSQSPQFYSELLESRPILEQAVATKYLTGDGRGNKTLVELDPSSESRPLVRREIAIARLAKAISVNVSLRTGVLTYTVSSDDAILSQGIAVRLLDLLNDFNRRNRQSQAGAERKFTETRLSEVTGNLRAQEDRLQSFLQGNREVGNAPALRLQQDRLERDVGALRQLQATLTLAFEQARIEEVRDTPVITIIQSPEVAVAPRARGLLTRTVLGGAVGIMLGLLLAIVPVLLGTARTSTEDEAGEFERLRGDTVFDVKRPWHLLGPQR